MISQKVEITCGVPELTGGHLNYKARVDTRLVKLEERKGYTHTTRSNKGIKDSYFE